METEYAVKIKPSRDLHEKAWSLLQSPVHEYADLERYYAAPDADRPLEVQCKARGGPRRPAAVSRPTAARHGPASCVLRAATSCAPHRRRREPARCSLAR